jgi:hypothetical protein
MSSSNAYGNEKEREVNINSKQQLKFRSKKEKLTSIASNNLNLDHTKMV